MIYYNYSPNQLEQEAEKLLKNFDAERFVKIKPIDVYEVIEKCLDVPYDWKYLTPEQSYLGLTAFDDGYIWVWDKPFYEKGMRPQKLSVKKGTIIIDATLTESDNRGRENFTVLHEVFHQILHEKCFRHSKINYSHMTKAETIDGKRKQPMTALERIESQANACAAAFLMPRDLTKDTFKKIWGFNYKLDTTSCDSYSIIAQLASEFNVSKQAMKYRLINLGLAK